MITLLARQLYYRGLSVTSWSFALKTLNIPSQHRFIGSSAKSTVPEGSWDSHIHVIEPQKYLFPKDVNPPGEAAMEQALNNSERLGIPNMVFVQISTYGTDNTWLLDALKMVGPAKGRGVVVFKPEQIDSQTLQLWHNLGVRGVRLNLRSTRSSLTPGDIRTVLHKYAEKLRPMKTWSIGLYADMKMLDYVQPLVSKLGIKIVLEHLASPAFLPLDPARMPGWEALKQDDGRPSCLCESLRPLSLLQEPGV